MKYTNSRERNARERMEKDSGNGEEGDRERRQTYTAYHGLELLERAPCRTGPNHVEQAHEPVVRPAQVTSLMVDQICSSEKQRSKPIKSTRAAYPHSSHRLIELVFSSDTYV
jgi:hypothetical protein